nr:MAG TPA: hypothetical protein [Caudoviricetes sp.]
MSGIYSCWVLDCSRLHESLQYIFKPAPNEIESKIKRFSICTIIYHNMPARYQSKDASFYFCHKAKRASYKDLHYNV